MQAPQERIEIVKGSHGDADVVNKAFAGADTVFWLVPPDPRAKTVDAAYVDFTRPACAAFKAHGVKRVVGISALGRGTPAAAHAGLVTASLKMDDLIASAGVHYRAVTNPDFGATFGQVYTGAFHYLIWNDQFYSDPEIHGCGDNCG